MVPSVDDACSHMLALGRDFITVGGLLDVDCKLLIGPVAFWRSAFVCTEACTEIIRRGYRLHMLGRTQGIHGRSGLLGTLRGNEEWMQCV